MSDKIVLSAHLCNYKFPKIKSNQDFSLSQMLTVYFIVRIQIKLEPLLVLLDNFHFIFPISVSSHMLALLFLYPYISNCHIMTDRGAITSNNISVMEIHASSYQYVLAFS